MSPFLTFKDADKEGNLQLYILQRAFPHYVGVLSYIPVADSFSCIPLSGHNLWINYAGLLRGNFIPSYGGVNQEIEAVFHSMALWFYSERILKDPKRYKKWLIPVS